MTQTTLAHKLKSTINQEQEALATEPKLQLVHKYLPETETYLSYKYRIKNRRHVLKKLKRAGVAIEAQKTDKTRKLHPKATLIAETVLNKIAYNREEEVILTHKYLNKITDCLADQNKRYVEQLANLFDARYERAYLKDGKFYEYCYVFKLNPVITEELKEAGVLESEFIPAKKPRSINNKDISNEIKIRSRANSSQCNFNSETKSNISSIDTKKEQVASTNETKAIVKQIQVKSLRPANTRKKSTKAQRKARIYQLPPQFDKPKTLVEMEPITEKECTILQSKSGREFTLNAQNQILQDMAKRLTRIFNSRWQFICYFSDCLRYEKRDAVQCSGNNFYIKANVTEENVLLNHQEKYLEETEQIAISQVSKINQYRAKLANALEHAKAYEFLMAFVNAKMEDNSLKITLNKAVELSEQELDIVLFQARAVFDNRNANGDVQYVESIEYVVNAANSNFSKAEELEDIQLPKGIWGKIVSCFIEEYGMELYKHWIAPLNVEEDNELILLSSNSGMILDRIMDKYWQRMSYYSEVHNIDLNIKYSC